MLTCKVISFPDEKIIYALLTFKRRPDTKQKLRSSRSFCRTSRKYSHKAENAKLLNYNHGGIKCNQPIRVSVNLPTFAESLPSSTNSYKTKLALFFLFRTALLITYLSLGNLSLIVNGPLLKSHNPVYYATGVLKCFCISPKRVPSSCLLSA